jgi:hypothetical protein
MPGGAVEADSPAFCRPPPARPAGVLAGIVDRFTFCAEYDRHYENQVCFTWMPINFSSYFLYDFMEKKC